jgi:hypothetical protein
LSSYFTVYLKIKQLWADDRCGRGYRVDYEAEYFLSIQSLKTIINKYCYNKIKHCSKWLY